VGPDIARQDLLIGLLSSLGRVGGIINQPRTQSSTVSSGGGFNQSVITTSAEPQIWAAALEGFFKHVWAAYEIDRDEFIRAFEEI